MRQTTGGPTRMLTVSPVPSEAVLWLEQQYEQAAVRLAAEKREDALREAAEQEEILARLSGQIGYGER